MSDVWAGCENVVACLRVSLLAGWTPGRKVSKSWLALLGVVFFEQIKFKMCLFQTNQVEVLSR
jgi:hypothetical protein